MQAELADREDLLDEVVTSYFRAVGAGQTPDRGEWLARYPDLAADLNEFFADQDEVLELAAPLRSIALTPEATGQTFGDFEKQAEIGRGGMGIVYKARQKSLNRTVALKVLPFAATMDARALQRFQNEARAAAGLHHTNIVPVYFVGSERGVHYYAMQFIEGQDLASVLAQLREHRGRPETDRNKADIPLLAGLSTEPSARSAEHFRAVTRLGIQAAEALDYAHQQGIVHRDVKPANLLVDADGRLWVTDFGLAQMQSDTRLTMTGDLVGTLRYMSPEQALAKRVVVDHRTDIYSLGATLYELLTLEPAFDGKDRQELLGQIAFEEPRRPRQRNRAMPQELETIVLKAMEKKPADRYATAQKVADDLRRYLEDRPIRARRPSAYQRAVKWCKRHTAAVVAAAAVSFFAAVGLAVAVILIGDANTKKGAMLVEKNQALHEKDDALGQADTAWKQEAKEKAAAEAARDRANTYLDDVTRIAGLSMTKNFDSLTPKELQAQGNLLASVVDLQEKAAADTPDKAERWFRLLQLTIARSGELQEENRFLYAIGPQKRAVDVCRHWIAAFPNHQMARQAGPLLLIRCLVDLGSLLCATGQLDEGEKVYAEALERLGKLDERRDGLLLWECSVEIQVKLGCARTEGGRHAEAAQAFDKAFALIQVRKPDVPPKEDFHDSQWHETVQWQARCRIGSGKLQLAQRHSDEAVETFRLAVQDFKKIEGNGNDVNDDDLEYAWFLVTCPVKEILNPAWAMKLANKVIEQEAGNDQPYRSRLAMALRVRGLANYIGGDWAACSADLNRALNHRFHYDLTRFIHAMAYARLGDKKRAIGEYAWGVRWMNNNRPKDAELHRLQGEAAAMLGIKEGEPAKPKDAKKPG